MVRILYQYAQTWPEQGPLRVDTRFQGEIPVSPTQARRKANGYLAREIALFLSAGEPLLILGEQPRWQVPAVLHLRGYGRVAEVGTLEVDARTSEVIDLSEADIERIRERAHEIVARLTPAPATAS